MDPRIKFIKQSRTGKKFIYQDEDCQEKNMRDESRNEDTGKKAGASFAGSAPEGQQEP